MAIHITNPVGTYLPGKDDNIYEFYGDNAADYANYPDYFYQVQLKIDNVVKDVYKYVPNGTTPIRINIRNLIAPYFSYDFENDTTEMPYLPSHHAGVNKVLATVLVIRAYYITPAGVITSAGESNSTGIRYYWNGTSNDFWSEKYNYDTIRNYIPTGSTFPNDRPQWVGPKKPLSFPSAYPSRATGVGRLQPAAKNAAYDIHRGTYRTASAVLYDTDTHYFNDQYYVACYDCDGKMTKSGISIFDMRADFVPNDKFITIPVGIPQINALAVTSLQSGKIFFQLTAYGASIGSEKYIDDKDAYYQVMLMKSNVLFEDQVNSTIPLTFRINEGKPNDRRNMNYIDILYYSKLGAWWQIPAYKRNYKETNIKTDSYTLSDTVAKTISSRNRKTVHVEATDEYVVNTDWLDSQQISEVEDMIQSPSIYLCIGGVNIPVSLADSSYTIDTADRRNLRAYTFKFKTDYNKQVIR